MARRAKRRRPGAPAAAGALLLMGLVGCLRGPETTGTGAAARPSRAGETRVAFGPVLDRLASPEVLPANVWFRRLSLKRPAGPSAGGEAAARLSLECYARSLAVVERPADMREGAEAFARNVSREFGMPVHAEPRRLEEVDLRPLGPKPGGPRMPKKALRFVVECEVARPRVAPGGGRAGGDERPFPTREGIGDLVASAIQATQRPGSPVEDDFSTGVTERAPTAVAEASLEERTFELDFHGGYRQLRGFVAFVEAGAACYMECRSVTMEAYQDGLAPGAGKPRCLVVVATFVRQGR